MMPSTRFVNAQMDSSGGETPPNFAALKVSTLRRGVAARGGGGWRHSLHKGQCRPSPGVFVFGLSSVWRPGEGMARVCAPHQLLPISWKKAMLQQEAVMLHSLARSSFDCRRLLWLSAR